MKNILFRSVLLVLSLVMVFSMFTACGKQAEPSTDAIVDAAVKAALDAVESTTASSSVIFDVDGTQITVENAAGKTIRQLLEQAGISLSEGDRISVDPDQLFSGSLILCVNRKCTVTVVVEETGAKYTVSVFDGTVADALAAAGVELKEYHTVSAALDQLLENGMEIVVAGEEEPEETEPTEPAKNTGSSSGSRPSSGSSGSSGSSSQKTVVSVQKYDDCDGSGHGVKVITYSDGTQVEVPY